jgi:hypothetical protein
MKIHHTTIKTVLGNCLVCGKPILMLWKDASEQTGQSETYTEKKEGVVHFTCTGGKSLHQLNEERRLSNEVQRR